MYIQKILPNSNNNFSQGSNINFKTANLAEVEKLTKEISKRLYGKKGAMDVYSKFPLAEGISMGTSGLPQSWLKRIKDITKFDPMVFCERLGLVFTEDRHFSNIDSMRQNLRTVFKNFGIIEKNEDLDVTYLEKGFFGRAYKIDINDGEPKVMKEYKRTYRYHNNHGNYAEQNIAEYIDHYTGSNTNVAKYYYGDTKHGIMLMDFISEDTPLPEKIVELDELGLGYGDAKPRNFVNKYIIDDGGMETISNLVGRRQAQNTYRTFKYLNDNTEKRELFETIINDVNNENYDENLIGLTHSIKFFPEKEQPDLYRRIFAINKTNTNIALVENVKNFSVEFRNNEIEKGLAATDDVAVKEIIAREIKHFPASITHSLMEKYALEEDNNTIKKYLARNLNYYYKNRENRVIIFDNLMKNADTYANIALVNSLTNLPLNERDVRFGKFLELNDVIVTCALVRNIEIFNNDEQMLEKWLDKLMEIQDVRVKRALCESVKYLPEKIMANTFEKLLNVYDMNAKEFLAETLTSIPRYNVHPEWFDKILEASGNSVKRELAKALKTVQTQYLKQQWAKVLNEKGDSSVKKILKEQGLV